MAELEGFGEPDREGFEVLIASEFVTFKGMFFRKATFAANDIESQLITKSRETVQREFNHTHLFLYAADIQIQREWSGELIETWEKRWKTEFPGLNVCLDTSDNGQEVILTFWATSQQSECGP